MAGRGLNVTSEPYELRFRPSKRQYTPEPKTRGDRLVCGVCGAVMGLFLWTVAYLITAAFLLKAALRAGQATNEPLAHLPTFTYGGIPVALLALFAYFGGVRRLLTVVEKVLDFERRLAERLNEN
jgi:hypothetical protein